MREKKVSYERSFEPHQFILYNWSSTDTVKVLFSSREREVDSY